MSHCGRVPSVGSTRTDEQPRERGTSPNDRAIMWRGVCEATSTQDALKLSADDSEMVQTMLERIKARLRFLG